MPRKTTIILSIIASCMICHLSPQQLSAQIYADQLHHNEEKKVELNYYIEYKSVTPGPVELKETIALRLRDSGGYNPNTTYLTTTISTGTTTSDNLWITTKPTKSGTFNAAVYKTYFTNKFTGTNVERYKIHYVVPNGYEILWRVANSQDAFKPGSILESNVFGDYALEYIIVPKNEAGALPGKATEINNGDGEFRVSLGYLPNGKSAGFIDFQYEPSYEIEIDGGFAVDIGNYASPLNLNAISFDPSIEVITRSVPASKVGPFSDKPRQGIRQIITPQTIVDVSCENGDIVLKFYAPQKTAARIASDGNHPWWPYENYDYPDGTGPIQVSDEPFVTYRINSWVTSDEINDDDFISDKAQTMDARVYLNTRVSRTEGGKTLTAETQSSYAYKYTPPYYGGDGYECPMCEYGYITCENCDGKGYVMDLCEECNGTGRVTCDKCEGEGVIRCPADCDDGEVGCNICDGEGLVICDKCNGEGIIPCTDCDDGIVYCEECDGGKIPCQTCEGDGHMACEYCVEGYNKCLDCVDGLVGVCTYVSRWGEPCRDGYLPCYYCGGEGWIRDEDPGDHPNEDYMCTECWGSGIGSECPECGGAGLIYCDKCEGGEIPCEVCGTDWENQKCWDCDGTGFVECEECGGWGMWECEECNGYGYFECDEWMECPNDECDKGMVPCPEGCDYGYVDCDKCVLEDSPSCVRGELPCDVCEGEGVITWPCSECHGAGFFMCDYVDEDTGEPCVFGYISVKESAELGDSNMNKLVQVNSFLGKRTVKSATRLKRLENEKGSVFVTEMSITSDSSFSQRDYIGAGGSSSFGEIKSSCSLDYSYPEETQLVSSINDGEQLQAKFQYYSSTHDTDNFQNNRLLCSIDTNGKWTMYEYSKDLASLGLPTRIFQPFLDTGAPRDIPANPNGMQETGSSHIFVGETVAGKADVRGTGVLGAPKKAMKHW